MKTHLLYIGLFCTSSMMAQGLINNGAKIILANNINVVIEGTAGNFTNQGIGTISNNLGTNKILLKGNWTNNGTIGVFTNDGITTELNGGAQSIGGSSSTTFYNLTLNGTGDKTLNSAIKVGGISILNGILSLNDRQLILNQRALTVTNQFPTAITRTSGYVVSETNTATNTSIIKWNTGNTIGNYIFPFGLSGSYIPVIINKTSTNASDISVSTRATPTNNNIPWTNGVTSMASFILAIPDASVETTIDRWYEINSSSPIVADLTLHYRGIENTTTLSPTGVFAMQRWNGQWETQQGSGAGVTSGIGGVTANSVSDFSTFVLTTLTSSGPLPVTLIDFSTSCTEGNTSITWTTASESNSDKFVVKRSRDGINWQIVDEISAAGNSNFELHYSIIDNAAYPGVNYYQLEQHDLNGEIKIYTPISSDCKTTNIENSFSVYPNPTTNGFQVMITHSTEAEDGLITLSDISGKIIEKRMIKLENGVNSYFFDTTQLAAGTYILSTYAENKFTPMKVVVMD